VLRDGVIASAQGLEDMQNLRLVHLTASRKELMDGKIFAPVEKHSRSRSTITPGSANLLVVRVNRIGNVVMKYESDNG
jgi:hypothetical protein